MRTIIIGIDPGARGGLAWRAPGRTPDTGCCPMPTTRGELIRLLRALVGDGDAVAYIENPTGFIPDASRAAQFEFGRNVERVFAVCETLGIRIVEVRPQAWQAALGLGTSTGRQRAPRGATPEQRRAVKAQNARAKRDWKRRLLTAAGHRFSGLKITLKTSDAVLLLAYGLARERLK